MDKQALTVKQAIIVVAITLLIVLAYAVGTHHSHSGYHYGGYYHSSYNNYNGYSHRHYYNYGGK